MAIDPERQAVRSPVVSALFHSREQAAGAYQLLLDLDYQKDDITVLMSDKTHDRYFTAERVLETKAGTRMTEGVGIGGGIGASLGALAAAIAAIGTTVLMPGLGLVIAGPLAAGLAGAGAGAVTGGLIGALVGYQIPEERARIYEKGIMEGGIWISVVTRSNADAAKIAAAWEGFGGEHIHS